MNRDFVGRRTELVTGRAEVVGGAAAAEEVAVPEDANSTTRMKLAKSSKR